MDTPLRDCVSNRGNPLAIRFSGCLKYLKILLFLRRQSMPSFFAPA
ncbi:MAG: hypothetical protein IKX14_03495 [Neisseriaceae bacterium]|nr:hypothetical protein [Neisseriaceae bacterium]